MEILNAKYYKDNDKIICISCTLNGKNTAIPLDPENTDYIEIMKQVDAGTLTIKDAD